jgi:hypothetical protein
LQFGFDAVPIGLQHLKWGRVIQQANIRAD